MSAWSDIGKCQLCSVNPNKLSDAAPSQCGRADPNGHLLMVDRNHGQCFRRQRSSLVDRHQSAIMTIVVGLSIRVSKNAND